MSYKRIAIGPDGHPFWDYAIEMTKRSAPGHVPKQILMVRKNIRNSEGWVDLVHEDYASSWAYPDTNGLLTLESTSIWDDQWPTAIRKGINSARLQYFTDEYNILKNNNFSITGTTPNDEGDSGIGIWLFEGRRAGEDKPRITLRSNDGDIICRHPDGVIGVIRAGYAQSTDGIIICPMNWRFHPYLVDISSASVSTRFELRLITQNVGSPDDPNVPEFITTVSDSRATIDLRMSQFAQAGGARFVFQVRNLSPIPTDIYGTFRFILVDQRCLTPRVGGTGVGTTL